MEHMILTQAQANAILEYLGGLPYKHAAPLIDHLKQEWARQEQAAAQEEEQVSA